MFCKIKSLNLEFKSFNLKLMLTIGLIEVIIKYLFC